MRRTERQEIDRLYEIALWYQQLRESSNEAFLPLFADEHRYLVLKGGGGSGKSIFAGRKVLERVTSEPGHRWLVCRKVAKTLRESCFKQLLGQLAEFYPDSGYKPNKSDLAISFRNGSEIIFAGLDGVERGLTPPEPTNINLYTAGPAVTENLEVLPGSLSEAKRIARESDFIRSVLPEEMLK